MLLAFVCRNNVPGKLKVGDQGEELNLEIRMFERLHERELNILPHEPAEKTSVFQFLRFRHKFIRQEIVIKIVAKIFRIVNTLTVLA